MKEADYFLEELLSVNRLNDRYLYIQVRSSDHERVNPYAAVG